MMRRLLLTGGLLAGLLGLIATANAAATTAKTAAKPDYPVGQFYLPVKQLNPPDNPKQIRVQEFFWFGCPHCFRLDPTITAWSKKLPKDVVFERVPNNLGNPVGVLDEQAFYAAKLLGVEHKIHTPLFDAIHVQHMDIGTKDALRDFIVKTAGVTPEQYSAALNSFEVDSNVRRADQLAMDDGVLSVPCLVIGGAYRIDIGLPGFQAAKGDEASHYRLMLKVADYLIQKVRDERKAGS